VCVCVRVCTLEYGVGASCVGRPICVRAVSADGTPPRNFVPAAQHTRTHTRYRVGLLHSTAPEVTGVEVRVEPSLATGSASGPGSVVACGPSIHYTEWNSRYDKDTIPKDTRSQPIHWPAADEKRINRNQPSSSCWRMFRSYSAWGHGRKGVARRGHREGFHCEAEWSCTRRRRAEVEAQRERCVQCKGGRPNKVSAVCVPR
jgi:hypothetical protein